MPWDAMGRMTSYGYDYDDRQTETVEAYGTAQAATMTDDDGL